MNKMNKTLASIIIPAYNNPGLLENTLKTVINQTYKNIEILVCDDGSEIDLSLTIDKLNDSRIKLHKLHHNNANVARNHGIFVARGKYIAMLDSDDLWLENHISDCIHLLESSGADGMYGSLILRAYPDMERGIVHARELYQNESMPDYLLSTGCGAQTSTLFMTTVSARSTLWDPEFIDHQDYDFVIRYSDKYNLIPKTEPTVIYVMRENSLSKKSDFKSYVLFADKYRQRIKKEIYLNYNLMMRSKTIARNDPKYITDFFDEEISTILGYE